MLISHFAFSLGIIFKNVWSVRLFIFLITSDFPEGKNAFLKKFNWTSKQNLFNGGFFGKNYSLSEYIHDEPKISSERNSSNFFIFLKRVKSPVGLYVLIFRKLHYKCISLIGSHQELSTALGLSHFNFKRFTEQEDDDLLSLDVLLPSFLEIKRNFVHEIMENTRNSVHLLRDNT